MKKLNRSKVLPPLITFLVVIGAWQLVTALTEIPSYILPSPSEILKSYRGSGAEMWNNYLITMIESFLGMVLGSVIGFFVGLAMAESDLFKRISLPFLIASNAIPIIAIAPILIIWFGSTLFAKVVIAAFISFFPIVLNSYRGLTEYPENFKELFMVYGATEFQFLTKFKLRNALPYIATGLKLNATLSVIGAIVGEFVSATSGVGFGILQSSYSFNSPKLWAYIIMACSIGLILYSIIFIFERKIIRQ